MPTLQDDSRLSTERRPQPPILLPPAEQEKQRKRMLLALGLLLVTLFAVVIKDWDFWFPPPADDTETTTTSIKRAPATAPAPAAPATPTRSRKVSKPVPAPPEAPFTAKTERTALPPLQVEVVAGNRHSAVPAKNNAIHLDLGAPGAAPASTAAVAERPVVSDRVQVSPEAAENIRVPVAPNYPLLARQMKVQGAVILQALISRDGSIQELQVLSGPGILAAAAREAVKQWRFKPYYLSGQPVETEARITVNFTISTN